MVFVNLKTIKEIQRVFIADYCIDKKVIHFHCFKSQCCSGVTYNNNNIIITRVQWCLSLCNLLVTDDKIIKGKEHVCYKEIMGFTV